MNREHPASVCRPGRLSAALAAGSLVAALALLAGCAAGGGAVARNSKAAAINLQLGIDYMNEGQLELAKTKLELSRAQNPGNYETHEALALVYGRLGYDPQAGSEYRRAMALAPNNPDEMNNYASFLCSQGRTDEGVRYFTRAAQNPGYNTPWRAYTNAGVCLRAAHRYTQAARAFQRALQINPGYSEGVYQAAQLQLLLHHDAAARLLVDTYLVGSNNSPTPDLLLLGWQVARAQHDADGATSYAAQLRKLFPNSLQARALTAPKPKGSPGG